MIILEGMDNSGKSTFGKLIGLPVVNPGGKPKNDTEESGFMVDQCYRAIVGEAVVFDRVTCISQQVYRSRMMDARYMSYLESMLASDRCFLVYCRPPDDVILDFTHHQVKDYEDPEDVKRLMGNAKAFIKSYDKLMSKIPHIRYNYTNCRTEQLATWLKESQTDWSRA